MNPFPLRFRHFWLKPQLFSNFKIFQFVCLCWPGQFFFSFFSSSFWHCCPHTQSSLKSTLKSATVNDLYQGQTVKLNPVLRPLFRLALKLTVLSLLIFNCWSSNNFYSALLIFFTSYSLSNYLSFFKFSVITCFHILLVCLSVPPSRLFSLLIFQSPQAIQEL